MARPLRLTCYLVAIGLLASACNLPTGPSGPQNPGAIYTAAAQTVLAQLTPAGALPGTPAGPTSSAATAEPTSVGGATATVAPGISASAVPTSAGATATVAAPTHTAAPTDTPQPSATPLPPTFTPTATPIPPPCLWAEYVKDVTIPDGTTLPQGAGFTKTWRLKNIGSCTWDPSYSLVFASGDPMGGKSVPLPGEVRPGQSVNVSVNLFAPAEAGSYKGNWMLRAGSKRFGIGAGADRPFFVTVKVTEIKAGIVYNFADNYCSARWESSAGDLPCPGQAGQAAGFVLHLDAPDLESRHENESTIWTNPQLKKDGWISGAYPAIPIKTGDRFRAVVGCLAGYKNCDVVFQVNYRVGASGPSVQPLGEWHEVYDGVTTQVDLDLSALAGKSVQFILTVQANGDPKSDAAFWFMPQVYRP